MKSLKKPILSLFTLCALFICTQALTSGNAAAKSWFTAASVAVNTWKIDDNGNDNIYLLAGIKQALLIDTGVGRSDLAGFVRTLTKLPVVVINTHGHPDHSGGNSQFSEILAHPDDFGAIRNYMRPNNPQTGSTTQLSPLTDGQHIDLGNRVVEIVTTPGHTPGSICVIDPSTERVFTGDTSNGIVWLFLRESLPLETYLSSLQKLKIRTVGIKTIMTGHADSLDISFLTEMITCTGHIISGDCISEPYNTFAGSASLSRYLRAGVAYDPKKIRNPK
jgi:glyoxylase-like metal-dependent hydrolase (beta-lactamase superfamily II)